MTVVMVEHNMELVMTVADRVLVMNYGQYLFEGTPSEVQAHPEVIDAYLGSDVQ
jgi:branched-chain amino acid transport system ATP-binding protein